MKVEHVNQVAVFYEPEPARRRKVGRLALRQRQILFEYDPGFLGSKLKLSPFHLRLTPDVVVGRPAVFDGLMGVFDDSLPDGWGRLLIDRRAAELGMSGSSLTPLDRLTVVGARSMGTLVYEPEIGLEDPALVKLSELANQADLVMRNASGADLDRLIAVGGSPQGARPKVLIQLAPDGDVHFGAKTIQPGFTAWRHSCETRLPRRSRYRSADRRLVASTSCPPDGAARSTSTSRITRGSSVRARPMSQAPGAHAAASSGSACTPAGDLQVGRNVQSSRGSHEILPASSR